MRKFLGGVFIFFSLFSLSTSSVFASLVVVGRDGEVVANVLGSEIGVSVERPSYEVKDVTSFGSEEGSVALERDGERVSLFLTNGGEEKYMDVTGYVKELVEIEKSTDPENISILNTQEGFLISQRGVSARTEYSIFIDPSNRELSLETPSGKRYLGVLPYEAVLSVVKANIINTLNVDGEVVLREEVGGDLLYEVLGEKSIKVINLIDLSVPVDVSVSASTGQIVSVNQPVWFRVLDILFA
jgi:hypothetical protein